MTKSQEAKYQASLEAWAVGCQHSLGSIVTLDGRHWRVIEANHSTEHRKESYRLQLVTDEPFASTCRVDLEEIGQ